MSLIYHYDRILAHPWIKLHFLQQNAVSHNFDFCGRVCFVLESHLVSHETGVCGVQLLCDKFAHNERCNSSRLRNRKKKKKKKKVIPQEKIIKQYISLKNLFIEIFCFSTY